MAVHTWVDGEAITASKLNKLEKKKAYVENTLDFTTCTAREVLEMIEDMPLTLDYIIEIDTEEYPDNYNYHFIYLPVSPPYIYFRALTLDDYLEIGTGPEVVPT